MTKRTTTRSDDAEATPRPTAAQLAVAVAALALLCAGAGLATAQTDGPAVSVSNAELSPSGTAAVDVVLTSAPDGLAGYNIALTIEDPDVAHIRSARYPDRFDLTTDPSISEDGRTVTLEAADVGSTIGAGAENVTLATVEIAGDAPGEAEITVDLRQVDGNDGEVLRPAAGAGTLTVTEDPSAGGGQPSVGGADSTAAGSDADSTGAGPIAELSRGAGRLSTGALALLVALVVLAALVAARRRL